VEHRRTAAGLEGRVAVVTGRGQPESALPRCAASPTKARRSSSATSTRPPGQAAADEVDGLFVRTDVTNADDVAAMFDAAKSTYGSVDIAFNDAGIFPPDDDSILRPASTAWRRVQEVNLAQAVYLRCKAVLPIMLEQGKGSIINTASFVAHDGGRHLADLLHRRPRAACSR